MWYGFSPEAWQEWCVANNFDPSDMEGTMAKIQAGPEYVCITCKLAVDLNEVYIQLDAVAPIVAAKFMHRDCFIQHMEEHGHEDDHITCYIYRKRV